MKIDLTALAIFFSLFLCTSCQDAKKDQEPESGNGQETSAPASEKKKTATVEEVKEDLKEATADLDDATEKAGEALAVQKQKLVDKWRARSAEIDQRIDNLEKKGKELTADAKSAWQDQVAALKSQRDTFEKKIDEVADDTGDAWSDLETGLDKAWRELSDAVDRAAADFKEPEKKGAKKPAGS